MKDPLGVSPSKWNLGTTRGKEKILLTSVGIEPKTSGLDLPLLCGQRKSRTIMVVNRGEEKVRVHMKCIYTSELFLCSIIGIHSATRHNIHTYPYFLFHAIHHFNRLRLSLSDLVAHSAEYR